MPTGPTTALATLLDEELCFDATTADHLSNHLPMALVALQRLGGSDDRLAAFAARYRHRLAPVHETAPFGGFDEWRAARGQHGTYVAARGYLEACVERDGVEATVRRHLAELVDGLSGAAFHGLIRVAYALESASPARVAAGLAYLTEVHQPLGTRGHTAALTDDPLVALGRLSRLGELHAVEVRGNIGERMRAIARHPAFAGVVDWLAVDESTPRKLTEAATALYALTDDFTALHGLTASHAVAVVSGYVDDHDALCGWWFQALAAAYLTIGAPRLDEPSASLGPWLAAPSPWDDVAAAATLSDDEHVVKLVYSARSLDAVVADPLLLAAAARQAGLAPARG
jgi:hypothetical protein